MERKPAGGRGTGFASMVLGSVREARSVECLGDHRQVLVRGEEKDLSGKRLNVWAHSFHAPTRVHKTGLRKNLRITQRKSDMEKETFVGKSWSNTPRLQAAHYIGQAKKHTTGLFLSQI